jgi:hypothetical protein
MSGPKESLNGPHTIAYTSQDSYPCFQQLNWSHDNISLHFDVYYNGQFVNGFTGWGYSIYKLSNVLYFKSQNGSQGSQPSIFNNMYLNGNQVGIGQLGTGTVYSNGSYLTNTNPSDATLKTNINLISNSLSIVSQLNPVSYNWIDTTTHNSNLNYGFLAQDVKEVIPDIVSEFQHEIKGEPLIDDTGLITYPNKTYETKVGYDPVSLIPFLVGAIKEQQSTIVMLQKLISPPPNSSIHT